MVQEEDSPDVSTLGLVCGLEIHQQLDTDKLFCRCPRVLREDKPDFEVVRVLRASAGETGEIDLAAKHERAKAKRFRYQGHHGTTCLVELDEEPPHPLNEKALEAALQVAKLVKSAILPEVHVMRKTVIDGSNTSGFQRTALVAMGGVLPEEKVGVQSMCLEEEACKIISRSKDEDVYDLNRLGIPLIELATAPEITTPEQAQRVAAEIGMILRSTGKCKRGLGTIRQDLNVSIKGGSRVEIKGAQDLRLIADLVRNEALRQRALLDVREELRRRGVTEFLLPPPHDLTHVFTREGPGFVRKGLVAGNVLMGLPLIKCEGLIGKELLPGYRVGTELAGYAKAFGFGGLIHSDEDLTKYNFTDAEIAAAKKKLGVDHGDAFLLILGEKERVEEFFAFVLIPRLEHVLHGVPSEVRKANPDGTSSYLRPMPGAARMYPETDIPRVIVDETKIVPPKLLKEQEAELVKEFKITPAHAKQLLREGWPFHDYASAFKNLSPVFLATTLLESPKEVRARYSKELDLAAHEETLKEILSKADSGAIPREAVFELLVRVAESKPLDYSIYAMLSDDDVEKAIKKVIADNPGVGLNALMGKAMLVLRGKAPGQKVLELLQRFANGE